MDYIKWAEEYERDADKLQGLIRRLIAFKRKAKTQREREDLENRIKHYTFLVAQFKSTALNLRERGK